jgi:hypothetical protein
LTMRATPTNPVCLSGAMMHSLPTLEVVPTRQLLRFQAASGRRTGHFLGQGSCETLHWLSSMPGADIREHGLWYGGLHLALYCSCRHHEPWALCGTMHLFQTAVSWSCRFMEQHSVVSSSRGTF